MFPQTREQRCWVHKTANVLNKLPTGVQPTAKAMLYDIWMAETQPAADRAFDLFLATFAAKFPAATTCLAKDRDVLLTCDALPAEHWIHIRTTNPVESTFATVRLRTKKTKGAGQPGGVRDDGIQAGDGRAEALESVERVSVDRRCHRRCALRRWRQQGNRLITGHTQHLAISHTHPTFTPSPTALMPCGCGRPKRERPEVAACRAPAQGHPRYALDSLPSRYN